ncbi:MAG: NADH-quinone oxidoreductase subunit L [Polyangiaceae bacterium]|nr:NADH-quinone oxidoreductase subunit L [Polyangiaceae bacterium]
MEALVKVFPANDFSLLAVILCLPLIGAFINGVFGKRLGREGVTLMALAAVGGSFLAAVVSFLVLRQAQAGSEQAARLTYVAWDWLSVSGRHDLGSIPIKVAFSLDALNATMCLVVTGVGFLIHLYSTKYMEKDPGYHRFFAYLNLFIFSMLVLILGDSLPILFVGWEGVGLCSYLLIGFWFTDEKNAQAGKKAFIVNRIGDFGLLVAMALFVYHVGALDWIGIEGGRSRLLEPVKLWPIGNVVPLSSALPESAAAWLNTPRYVTAASLVGLALFLGCAGKSAQIPLYVWLPDAMAGPTPVSALIHAATMVTAGVYLVCRLSSVFVLAPAVMFTIALVGALTALLAASIAFAQNDIKKVLAYSTVSQLGYMFLGVGVGAFSAGFFHVVTHAFFKACLFLGAGSVIYAMHKRIHDTDTSQDMRKMGGMKKYMPVTFATFVGAWVAIIGFPGTSGFFSKDEILLKALTSQIQSPLPGGKITQMTRAGEQTVLELWQWPSWGNQVLFAMGVVGAVMTAFYMSRLVFGIFWGDFKGWTIKRKWKAPAHHDHDDHDHPHHHHDPDEPLEGPAPVESPWQMWLPLAVLAALSLGGGFLNAHLLHLHPMDDWLGPVFATAAQNVTAAEGGLSLVLAFGIGAFALGLGAAYWVYRLQGGEPARAFVERMPGLHRWAQDKFYVDEAYDEAVVESAAALADTAAAADKYVVDGIVAKLTSGVVQLAGAGLRFVQTGKVHTYAAVMVVGTAAVGWFLIAPHAQARTVHQSAGQYGVVAAPGFGYQYRWDTDGDGQWDSEEFSSQMQQDVTLGFGENKTLRLQVKNAFGRTAERSITVSRPKLDPTRGPATVIQIEQQPDGTVRGVLPGQQPTGGVQ